MIEQLIKIENELSASASLACLIEENPLCADDFEYNMNCLTSELWSVNSQLKQLIAELAEQSGYELPQPKPYIGGFR